MEEAAPRRGRRDGADRRLALTDRDVDDAGQTGPLLDQVDGPVGSFTGDGGYDQDSVYANVAERWPEAAVTVPLRSTIAEGDPTE